MGRKTRVSRNGTLFYRQASLVTYKLGWEDPGKMNEETVSVKEKFVMTVLGARPQFIKAAPVSLALKRAGIQERLVHTGQHYDREMSGVFFDSLGLDEPFADLGVGSASHGSQTGRMLEKLEELMLQWKPSFVLVYGDTNSTLAGALAAAKLSIPIAHVEAGLRSFNRKMPEEINRVLTDHVSDVLFVPTDAAVDNLYREGITRNVVRTGDVMYDAACRFEPHFQRVAGPFLRELGVDGVPYAALTVHRAENTDDSERWNAIIEGIRRVVDGGMPVVWPIHPRVRGRIQSENLPGVKVTEPLPYFEMQALVSRAKVVLTDSGGLQKEAAFHGVPCVTLRDETEWVELVDAEVNHLAGTNPTLIESLALGAIWPSVGLPDGLYGDGNSSKLIAETLIEIENSLGNRDE